MLSDTNSSICTSLNGLPHRRDPNRYYHLSDCGPKSDGNEKVLHIPQTPRLEFRHQMEFNVPCRTLNGLKFFFNTNNFNQHHSFVCTQLNGFKYSKGLNSSIWLIDGTQKGTNTLGQSGPGSNGNEEVFHIHQRSRTGASLSDDLVSQLGHLRRGDLTILFRDAVGIFYNPSQFGW